MATRFDDWEGDFLAHFGTKGMKWGIRRYQNEDGSLTAEGKRRYGDGSDGSNTSARKVSRDLRRLEKERAGAAARADYFNKKTAKAVRKSELKDSGRGSELSKRNQRRVEKAKAYEKLAKDSEKMSKKIIENALKKGYSVNSRNTQRFVRKGADKVLIIFGRKGTSVNSVKYHVKNNGLGLRTHKNSIGLINRTRHKSNFL